MKVDLLDKRVFVQGVASTIIRSAEVATGISACSSFLVIDVYEENTGTRELFFGVRRLLAFQIMS